MEQPVELLKRAASEIRQLRQQNAIMSARLDMFDKMMTVVNSQPPSYPAQGMSEDIAWAIDKYVVEYEQPKSE